MLGKQRTIHSDRHTHRVQHELTVDKIHLSDLPGVASDKKGDV